MRFSAGLGILLPSILMLLAPHAHARCSKDLLKPPNQSSFSPAGDEAEMRKFVQNVVEPVAEEGGRLGYLHVRYDVAQSRIVLQSKSTTGKQIGEYVIRFSSDANATYPRLGLPVVEVDGVTRSEIVVYERPDYEQLLRLQGIIRSMFRADRLMHPHLRPHSRWKTRASHPQQRAIAAMMDMERKRAANSALKLGLFSATGMGKTFTVAKYALEVAAYNQALGTRGWKKKPKVLAVIENKDVLDGISETFARELGMTNIAKIYGDNDRDAFGPDSELIAITRSSYSNRIALLHKLMAEDPDQPWIIMVDEGHHAGKLDGEFQAILRDLESFIDGRHRVVLPSANLWHKDTALIKEYLGGNIVAPMLEPSELAQLRQGENLSDLCRLDYYRSQEMGYLAPLFGIDMPTEEEAEKMKLFVANARKLALEGKVLVDPQKIGELVARILRDRRNGVWDRGVFFVRDTREANRYAEILTEVLGTEVRPYHSRDGVLPDTSDWISDRGDHAKSTNVHKYIVVVDKLREGVDIPKLNMAVFLRGYGMSMTGFLNLLQNMGRIHRVAEGKPDARVYDLIGYTRWLRDGLERISVEPRGMGGGPNNPHVYVGTEWMTPTQFTENYYRLFPSEASFYTEFPFFDLTTFRHGGFMALRRLAAALGITHWSLKYSPMQTLYRMAEMLPPSDERDDLLAVFSDKSSWGVGDGMQGALGKPEPLQRAFRGLAQIAQVLSMEQGNDDVTLDCSAIFVEKLAMRLFPWYRALTTEDQWRQFADKETGAMPLLLNDEATRLGQRHGRGLRAQRTLIEIARKLDDGPDKTRLLKILGAIKPGPDEDIDVIAWAGDDGYYELRHGEVDSAMRGVSGMARIYRGWSAIAMVWNRQHPDQQVNLDHIHTREEAEKLLDLIFGLRAKETLSGQQLRRFQDTENGGAVALVELASLFSPKNFSNQYGPKNVVLKAIQYLLALPDAPKEDLKALLAQVRSPRWKWSPTDGTNILSLEAPAQRTYRALKAIARLYARTAEGRGENGDGSVADLDLTTREGMHAFLTRLAFGFPVPCPNSDEAATFMAEVFPQISVEHSKRGLPNFWRDSGVRRLYESRIREMPASTQRDRILTKLAKEKLWGFTKFSASTAKQGHYSSIAKVFRAHYVALKLENLEKIRHTDERFRTSYAINAVSFVDLFPPRRTLTSPEEVLNIEIPEPTDAELDLFVDKQKGGFAEFAKRSHLFHIGPVYDQWGARDLPIKMAEEISKPSRNKLVKAIGGEAWSANDGMVRTRAGKLRIYRAFYALAVLFSETERGRGYDPKSILTHAGAHELVDRLLFGFVIPELTQEQVDEFMGPAGAFRQLVNFTAESMMDFKENGGVKRLYVGRIRSMPATDTTRRVLRVMKDDARWEWKPGAYRLASQGALETSERIYRAHYAAVYLQASNDERAVPSAAAAIRGTSARALFSTP